MLVSTRNFIFIFSLTSPCNSFLPTWNEFEWFFSRLFYIFSWCTLILRTSFAKFIIFKLIISFSTWSLNCTCTSWFEFSSSHVCLLLGHEMYLYFRGYQMIIMIVFSYVIWCSLSNTIQIHHHVWGISCGGMHITHPNRSQFELRLPIY